MERIQNFRSFIAIFWLGFFMAISFVEAPLKFTAPGVQMEDGLAIGRVVFAALNKIEWILFLILLATWFLNRPRLMVSYMILAAGLILALETFWILPVLDERAVRMLSGLSNPPSQMHFVYVFFEILKVPVLTLIGWQSIQRKLLFN